MTKSRDTSTRGNDKGGREVQELSPKDLDDLRHARALLFSARRQAEQYQQYGLVAIDRPLLEAMTHFIDLADWIME